MDLSTSIGIIGTIMAFLEIWKPKLCLVIEKEIDGFRDYFLEYFKAARVVVDEAKSNAEYVMNKLAKGIQPITSEQLKADWYAFLERMKSYFIGLLAILGYYLLLPIQSLISLLNVIGKGKAIGGIGIILNIVGLYIGWPVIS